MEDTLIKKPKSKSFHLLICFTFFSLVLAFLCNAEAPKKQKRAKLLKEITIPIVHVKGSHYEVGYQLGTDLKNNVIEGGIA